MEHESQFPKASGFPAQAAQAYARLMQSTSADRETGLGGKLLYAAELDAEGRALVVAANIAGAVTLVATADGAAQKQAIRDGVADFLVTSLDESLRILKNQLRKRETVAVCVALAPEIVEREMRERGVAPDLVRAELLTAPRAGAVPQNPNGILTWSVASAPAQWLPKLDAIALDCLAVDAWAVRRWLRLAPRFLGRLAGGVRLLTCDGEFATRFIERVRLRVGNGEIGVPVEIRSVFGCACEEHRFAPAHPPR